MIEDYIVEFLRIEDELTRQKRFSRKNEERLMGKSKALSGLHKTPLPVIRDSLDVLHWRLQVEELTKALEEEEDSPVQRQKVCNAVKLSIQGPRLAPLAKTLESNHNLNQVLDLVLGYCKNIYNVLDNLKNRLDKMSSPRSRMAMYNNSIIIINFIKYLQERNYIKDITSTLFELMVDKALMYTYKVTFDRSANEDLLNLDLVNNGRNKTRLEIALETLQDHRRLHSSGVNLRPVPEQMKNKIALLFQFRDASP